MNFGRFKNAALLLVIALLSVAGLGQGKGHGHGRPPKTPANTGQPGPSNPEGNENSHGAGNAHRAPGQSGNSANTSPDQATDAGHHHPVGPGQRPFGWDEGEKVGWGNCNEPPGLAKKDGCESGTGAQSQSLGDIARELRNRRSQTSSGTTGTVAPVGSIGSSSGTGSTSHRQAAGGKGSGAANDEGGNGQHSPPAKDIEPKQNHN
jgi:hypothetical protein